ncbi:NADH dehydrogenase [ubiquinone] iron-sulfur protein 6, mitochondrial-like [Ylistrum balloti]|uniref:NADH dehydrogenase [ubiquinone] iron-sulfur protein 6, mitochondrial-like n=1 Tax=Ylistrum balloti TaxID=509963 RepID=UPI0029058EFE|nr:NADH dehydrogenase [ubiquinone] iron-sulfur protein 6, mitochondrial-like [Ylistrum balloti]
MASLARTPRLLHGMKKAIASPAQFSVTSRTLKDHRKDQGPNTDVITHTGQNWDQEDHRRIRFHGKDKLVNKTFAQDLVAAEPVVVVNDRQVMSNSGGALGHPRVYINLDADKVSVCGYSGRKFIQKKYYDAQKHGASITYDDYMKEITAPDFCG